MSSSLFHIAEEPEWRKAQADGTYRPRSIAVEGFIHLSSRKQLPGTANTFFKGRRGLILLELAIPAEDRQLKWEEAIGPNGQSDSFPHYFAPIPVSMVRATYPLEPLADGTFDLSFV